MEMDTNKHSYYDDLVLVVALINTYKNVANRYPMIHVRMQYTFTH